MARRAPLDEKPFRPLDASVLGSVLKHVPQPETPSPTVEVRPMVSPALVEPSSRVPPPLKRAAPRLKKLDQEKRILFSREESYALDRLATGLAVEFGTPLKQSHLIRALTLLLLHAENDVLRRAREHGPMVRPPNGDMASIQRFERELARLLEKALRDALPLADPG